MDLSGDISILHELFNDKVYLCVTSIIKTETPTKMHNSDRV